MRRIMYEDYNNNASFLKELFVQVQALVDSEISWSISNLDFIPVDKGDFIGGVPGIEVEELYHFQKRILEEHKIIVTQNTFMHLLENIRTIDVGKFETFIGGKQLKITIFDGDIIEIDGKMENKLHITGAINCV